VKQLVALALLLVLITVPVASGSSRTKQEVPSRLTDTGLYVGAGVSRLAPGVRPYSPQYPLWTDGASKSRWVQLPAGARIDANDVDAWDFPVGTKFWKEFAFGGRKVETRLLWRSSEAGWTFATYVWNEAQTDATLVPAEGLPGVVEVAAGRRHTIPSIEDCRACHDNGRTEILGFTALQLSTDRDPAAPHAEPLTAEMVTLETLVEHDLFTPRRPEFVARPPRIPGDEATRAALGYLSANCGQCHNEHSSLATVRYPLKMSAYASDAEVARAIEAMLGRTAKWDMPDGAPGTTSFIDAALARMRSRRPSSQMPPLGTVVQDREAIELLISLTAAPSVRSASTSFRSRPSP
jgi:hypothetical protein